MNKALGVCRALPFLMKKMRENTVFEHFLPCKLRKEPKNRRILRLFAAKFYKFDRLLGFVVLFAFIFSSCATAPVANHSQKLSSQVQVYPSAYFDGRYTNTATLAFKDYNSFRILDAKAAESAEDIEEATAAKKSAVGEFLYTTGLLVAATACIAGAWLVYKYF